jgi:hypothetical protein
VFIDVSGGVVDGVKLPSSAGDFIDDPVCGGSDYRAVAAGGSRAYSALQRLHLKASRRSKFKVIGEALVRIWRAS